jgi:phosphoserine phosphatase RsbU/P
MLSHIESILDEKGIIDNCDKLASDILDGMVDWVRVIDKNGYTIYTNKSMERDLGGKVLGIKCYKVFNKDSKCRRCITETTLSTGEMAEKEESIADRIFSIKSSPVKDQNGNIYAVVEVFRDVTKERKLEKEIMKRNEIMSNDVAFARKIQKKILPKSGIYDCVEMSYLYRPCEVLSGDMFDIFKIDEEHIGFYVSDVVGHGVTASIMTMFIKQTMASIVCDFTSPAEAIGNLHKNFLELSLDVESYFTIFYGIINTKTKSLKFVNGGHNSIPFLLKKQKIDYLEGSGFPITSLFEEIKYEEKEVFLSQGDEMILYTDGIIEAKNRDGEEYGFERLEGVIKQRNCDPITEIKNSVDDFIYYELEDDFTILRLKVL